MWHDVHVHQRSMQDHGFTSLPTLDVCGGGGSGREHVGFTGLTVAPPGTEATADGVVDHQNCQTGQHSPGLSAM